MNQSDRVGKYITSSAAGEKYKAFIPKPLPPDPPLRLNAEHYELIEKANLELGRLDGITTFLPDTTLLLYFYIRKEAILSSQIEGTQSSLSDLLLFENQEAPGVPIGDVIEVSNYVAAMEHGLKRLHGGFPLSLRLIKEIHEILLSKGRGSGKSPGEFRRSQNWVGGTRPGNAMFVPPPPEKVVECMGDFEKFLHKEHIPVLTKASLAHVQFETIHPFLDGNGRLGRLLITFLLCAEGALKEPMLYLSLFFKTHRQEYYNQLQKVRTEGDWEGWLRFFLTGVRDTAEQAVDMARSILQIFEKDEKQIERLGRAASSVLRIHQLLQKHPITSIPKAAELTKISYPTVAASLGHLQKLGIVREFTGRERNKLFVYDNYVKLLSKGTEPLKENQ